MTEATMNKPTSILSSAAAVALAVSLFAVAELDTKASEAQSARYAYLLGCGGRYLRIDTQQHKVVSRGTIWDAPSTVAIRPDTLVRFDGCLVYGVQKVPQAQLIYAAVPKEGKIGIDGSMHYRIAALRLPNFELVQKNVLPFALEGSPTLLLDSVNKELLASYYFSEPSKGKHIRHDVMVRHGIPNLQRLATIDETYQNDEEGRYFLSDTPHWDTRGRIIDRYRILDENGKFLKRIDGYSLLSPDVKKEFGHLERVGVKGKKYLDVMFINSAANRMLFLVGVDKRNDRLHAGSGFLVYDVISQSILPPISTPYRAAPFSGVVGGPTVHLTPDGTLVVLENYEWRTEEGEGILSPKRVREQRRFKTGEIAVYDVTTGKLLRTIQLDEAPGFAGRAFGFSPDSEFMYYGSLDHIYAVDLTGTQETQVRAIEEKFSPVSLFFSDR